MNRTAACVCIALAALITTASAQSDQKKSATSSDAAKVPVIDGGVGPCSLELTISGDDGKSVYNATVKVHIGYGMGGFHHLDLQAGTNADGKVKFTGLPIKVHHPPLEFDAAKDSIEGSLSYDPASECHAQHEIKLQPPKPTDQPQ